MTIDKIYDIILLDDVLLKVADLRNINWPHGLVHKYVVAYELIVRIINLV